MMGAVGNSGHRGDPPLEVAPLDRVPPAQFFQSFAAVIVPIELGGQLLWLTDISTVAFYKLKHSMMLLDSGADSACTAVES